jgi:thioredoxin-like negative regulator of GroEL
VSSYGGVIEDYQGEKTLLVVVKAKWASVWRATGDVLSGLDRAEYDFVIIDADDNPDKVRELGVTIIPTVIVYQDNKEVTRLPNMMSAEQLP